MTRTRGANVDDTSESPVGGPAELASPPRAWKRNAPRTAARVLAAPFAAGVASLAAGFPVDQTVMIFALMVALEVASIRKGNTRWPAGDELLPRDRAIVVDAVRRGSDVGDVHLARAVIDYAALVVSEQDRVSRQRWFVWVIAGLVAAGAMGEGLAGHLRPAIVLGISSLVWLGIYWWVPRRGPRIAENAYKAERAARTRISTRA